MVGGIGSSKLQEVSDKGAPSHPFYIYWSERLLVATLKQQGSLITSRESDSKKESKHKSREFADDTTLLGGASLVITRRFKSYLHKFQEASGGKTSDAKCRIYAWNISIRKANKLE